MAVLQTSGVIFYFVSEPIFHRESFPGFVARRIEVRKEDGDGPGR